MLKFSPSRYNVQQQCLGKYYYTYVLNRRDNTLWPGTVAGTATHTYLEENLGKLRGERNYKGLPRWEEYWKRTLREELSNGATYKTPRGFSEELFVSTYEKFLSEVLRFLQLYLPNGTYTHEEEVSEVLEVGGVQLQLVGVVDLQVQVQSDLHVVDFKTTKNNEGWYFVDWNTDAQSLTYYYLLRNKNPRSFSYTVFNFEQKTVLTQSVFHEVHDVEYKLKELLQQYVANHNSSSSVQHWNPSDSNCKWCYHKSYCNALK